MTFLKQSHVGRRVIGRLISAQLRQRLHLVSQNRSFFIAAASA